MPEKYETWDAEQYANEKHYDESFELFEVDRDAQAKLVCYVTMGVVSWTVEPTRISLANRKMDILVHFLFEQ